MGIIERLNEKLAVSPDTCYWLIQLVGAELNRSHPLADEIESASRKNLKILLGETFFRSIEKNLEKINSEFAAQIESGEFSMTWPLNNGRIVIPPSAIN